MLGHQCGAISTCVVTLIDGYWPWMDPVVMETDGPYGDHVPEARVVKEATGSSCFKTVVLCCLTGIRIVSRVTARIRVWTYPCVEQS